MIITLNSRSEFLPGTLIVDKKNGVYGVVLSVFPPVAGSKSYHLKSYHVKSLNMSKYWLIRKLQLLIIKKAFQ